MCLKRMLIKDAQCIQCPLRPLTDLKIKRRVVEDVVGIFQAARKILDIRYAWDSGICQKKVTKRLSTTIDLSIRT